MSDLLCDVLFQSTTRSVVLELLFVQGVAASVSELARRSGLSPRSVGNEVRHLLPTGLVQVEVIGGADVVRANTEHVSALHLRGLLQTPSTPEPNSSEARKIRESLAGWGAPLANVRPKRHYPLTETLLRGLQESRQDGTVLRILPSVLSQHLDEIDWPGLREGARGRKLKAELGLLVDLTAELLGRVELKNEVDSLHDRRRTLMRFLPAVKSKYEAELAKRRSPDVAQRWGFWMNMQLATFRSLIQKHHA
jgi:hypothetical protein